ncbi:hypothetical protein BO221_01860 [Archangium sp. Cb G35]|uniref:hypothetical protein n=1 Tax=Archangium sp. Cb G35 TaxID=1920190 RepID=UPI000935EA1D|nr:hypothetical protein [Archangium sp. Cb G35]OJT26796.1 hypothetical protein BO221_01860 [Archangium sp. Cb G35]
MISYDIIAPDVETYVHGGLMLDYTPEERDPKKVYDDLEEFIEKTAPGARRPLKSQWFVETEETPNWWTTKLMKILDHNDRLFVCRIFPNSMPDPDGRQDTAYAGTDTGAMGSEIEWLNSHVRLSSPR